jgi:hypothetical protein
MRSAALDLTWYQYFLLDVIAVLLLTFGVVVIVVFFVFRALYRNVFSVLSKSTVHGPKKDN